MKNEKQKSKYGLGWISDYLLPICTGSSGFHCIVDDHRPDGAIYLYSSTDGRFLKWTDATERMAAADYEATLDDVLSDDELYWTLFKKARGAEFKDFAIEWNDLLARADSEPCIYKSRQASPLHGNFAR